MPECESLYKSILHDELKYYQCYDFEEFETQNPIIVTHKVKVEEGVTNDDEPAIKEAVVEEESAIKESVPVEAEEVTTEAVAESK